MEASNTIVGYKLLIGSATYSCHREIGRFALKEDAATIAGIMLRQPGITCVMIEPVYDYLPFDPTGYVSEPRPTSIRDTEID